VRVCVRVCACVCLRVYLEIPDASHQKQGGVESEDVYLCRSFSAKEP